MLLTLGTQHVLLLENSKTLADISKKIEDLKAGAITHEAKLHEAITVRLQEKKCGKEKEETPPRSQ
jgi:hypothetical protein